MADTAVTVAPVIDARLPAEVQENLRRKISRDRAGTAGCLAVGVGFTWAIVAVILHFAVGLEWWWIGLSAAPAVVGFFIARSLSAADSPDEREHQQFVEADDLDIACRGLLHRTQQAIKTILDSDVYAHDSLEHNVSEQDLRRRDAAKRELLNVTNVSRSNDHYLDLIERTGVDDKAAVAKLLGMTKQTAAAEAAFQDSLRHVNKTAETLVLAIRGS